MKYFILLIAAAVIFPGSVVRADINWDVYISQSKVNAIEVVGDSLWCATDGGIMLFDKGDSVYTSYLNGLELRSSNVEAVTVDANNDIWAGFRGHGVARIRNTGQEANWYTEEYGLISDSVTCIANVDNEIYYGTVKGIGKFVEKIPSGEMVLTDSLSGSTINDIFAVNDTILWVAGSDGVSRFNRESFDYDFFPLSNAVSLCSFNGNIYCATDSTIQFLDDGKWSVLGFPSGPDKYPFVAVASGGGELFCITADRLYNWDLSSSVWRSVDFVGMKGLFYSEYKLSGRFNLRALGIDNAGMPWIGGDSAERPGRGVHICSYDGGAWITRNPGGLNSNIIRRVDMDPEGGVWVSTTFFGVCYNSGNDNWISYIDSLSYLNYNIALICDSNGRLWSSALENPLDMVELGERLVAEDDRWNRFTRDEDGISSRHINIAEDPAGNIWFLSDDDYPSKGWGIDIVNASATEWISITPSNSDIAGGNVRDCVFDGSSAYLAINDYGVQVWNTGGFEWSSLKDRSDDYWYTAVDQTDLSSTELNALEIIEDNLWVASGGELLKQGSSGNLIIYTSDLTDEKRKILNNEVNDLDRDDFGNLWVATSAGLNIIDKNGEVKGIYTTYDYWKSNFQITYPNSVISPLPDAYCKSLAFDGVNDKMWVGTGKGIAGIDMGILSPEQSPLSELFLYPNPVYCHNGDDELKISGISGIVDVEIYNIEGELVHEKENISDGEVIWDILTINGFKVVSGIYIVRVIGNNSSEIRKVAVVR
ncbi:MAG: T9SS type A sorting domain-containing protein [Candidatus Krumholzibacteriota bacterium]|nr:T9SS type A sorting domain-containing protein [Candidatus Krumholzibacteriota bacterium]